jgi:pilus assembly protein CpaC
MVAGLLLCGCLSFTGRISAQDSRLPASTTSRASSPNFRVDESVERLEMIVRTSRILSMDFKVPRMLVNNTEIVKVTPLSPNQIQISALKPGVTQLNVWNEDDRVISIDVVVYGDARELENMLKVQFPEASLRVQPLAASVMISGFVPEAEMMSRIIETANDYYPKVINNMSVGGCQKILLHTRVMEVSRTKLSKLGFDWSAIGSGGDYAVQTASGLISAFGFTPGGVSTVAGSGGATLQFGLINGNSQFFGFIEALRQNNLVRVLAEPTLVTIHGRPATFNSGGEFPILVPQSLGTVSIQYRQYGTRVDFVPIVLGRQTVRLEVRPQVTEIDRSTAVNINNIAVPGLKTRMVETGVEMRVGQTLALAGLLSEREETENKGLPFVSELPWVGAPFRRTQTVKNEVELLITVTPEFADAMDAEEAPPCGPGQFSTAPCIPDQFFRGYMEVPRCDDCEGISGDSRAMSSMGPAPREAAPHAASAQPARRVAASPPAGPGNRPASSSVGDRSPTASQRGSNAGNAAPIPPAYQPASSRRSPTDNGSSSSRGNGTGGRISDRTAPKIIGPQGYDE